MKKLLISIVATASLALVAKADVAPLNATSFETLEIGKITATNKGAFLTDEDGNPYWTGYTDDSDLTVTALEAGAKGDVVRPKYWADKPDAKALAIDVDTPLARNITTAEGVGVPQAIGNGLYFDSMVQFTATEDAPEVTDGDKLIVWLKEIPGEGESATPTYKLCVTAATWDDVGTPTRKDYVNTNTEIAVDKDEWHRLTISAVINGDRPEFQVFVDGKIFQEGEVNKFLSLSGYSDENRTTLTSVSFKGKGAIDDLVWTTDDPLYVAPATTDVTVTYNGPEISEDGPFVSYMIDTASTEIVFTDGSYKFSIDLGKTVEFSCLVASGWTVEGFDRGSEEDGYVTWTKTVPEVTAEFTSLSIKVTKDEEPVAAIGDAKYTTLSAAIAAATEGAAEITLLADIATDAAFVVTKTVAINLNGKTVSATKNDTEGNGVFWVQQGGELTINGNGTVNGVGGNNYNIAIWADGGRVIINGGTYTNVGAVDAGPGNHFDLIYAKNGGSVVIKGGTFICQTPSWTLNRKNEDTTGGFVVTGGSFYKYDPTNFDTDEPVTTWCPEGYEATLKDDYYTVAEKTIKPVDPSKDDVVVTATSETDALSKVELSVTVPDGVEADTYKGYFKLSATDNGDGTWTVAAALDPEKVEPVIEATTDEDGVVTPAISFGPNGEVTINISNELPGLFYGVKYATTVGGVKGAKAIKGLTVTPAEGATAGFFSVEVDFTDKNFETPAAQQN